jgi:eukaryotic-like serine/threonine-protein kinase
MIAGKYVLDHLIGQGGMGAVFSARHVKLSKAVAIKIMLADASNPEAAQRFINEGRAAANIQNEHVVRVDDVDEEMGYAYMVLELLDGEDLAQVLDREPNRRIAPHIAVHYVLQALRGVAQAHAIGIVHRDLKPSNLFLAKRKDGSVVVKVLDFGISKAQGSSALAASPSALTSTKAMLGSPLYMSPEQLRSSKSVDYRADIWAMGVILYELMTGHLPFMGENLGELFAAILETDPVPLRHFADVHPQLEEIVFRCLNRKQEHRFQSANELAQALAPFASPVPPQPLLQGTAMLAPGRPPNLGLITPGAITPSGMSRPLPPPPGAITTGSGPRAVAGTVALGASTPDPSSWRGSAPSWQEGPPPPKKSPVPFIALGAVVAVALCAFGIVAMKSRPAIPAIPSAASTTEPQKTASASAVVSAPAPPVASSVASAAPAVSSAPAAPPVKAPATHHAPAPIKVDPPQQKVEPPKPKGGMEERR